MMLSRVQERYQLLKIELDIFRSKICKENKSFLEQGGRLPRSLQNTNSDAKYYGNKKKALRKTKLLTIKFQNIPQQPLTFQKVD